MTDVRTTFESTPIAGGMVSVPVTAHAPDGFRRVAALAGIAAVAVGMVTIPLMGSAPVLGDSAEDVGAYFADNADLHRPAVVIAALLAIPIVLFFAGVPGRQEPRAVIRVAMQYFDECPTWQIARDRLRDAKRRLKSTGSYLNIVKDSGSAAGVTTEVLTFLTRLVEDGRIRAVIDRRYPLEQIVEAHRYVEQGHKKGHVIITVAPLGSAQG